MGLKTTNYELERFGITLPNVYARLSQVDIDLEGNAHGFFTISKTREDEKAVETKIFNCQIDKNQLIHEQIYNAAKEDIFVGWEDDIIE